MLAIFACKYGRHTRLERLLLIHLTQVLRSPHALIKYMRIVVPQYQLTAESHTRGARPILAVNVEIRMMTQPVRFRELGKRVRHVTNRDAVVVAQSWVPCQIRRASKPGVAAGGLIGEALKRRLCELDTAETGARP